MEHNQDKLWVWSQSSGESSSSQSQLERNSNMDPQTLPSLPSVL